MRQYLLDTGPLAALLLERGAASDLVRPWLFNHSIATSMVVYGEVVEYIRHRSDFQSRQIALDRLMHGIYPHTLSFNIMDRYADLRRRMRRPYGPGLIGDMDTLIAATALERELTVVTTDRDFLRVPDLSVLLLDRRTLTVQEETGH